MIAAIEAQKQEIFNDVEVRARESIQQLETQKSEIEQKMKTTEAQIEQTEAILKRNVSAEIMQPNKFLDKTPQEEVGEDDQAQPPCVNESIPEFKFIKNEKLFNNVMAEKIGFFKQFPTKTRPHQSSVEGKGISDVTVGLEARFVLTTRNAEGEQCYDDRDRVAVEIKNHQGHDCATKAQIQDSKDGTYKVFSSDGIFLRTFGTKGDKQGEFDYPVGIAFDKNSGNIIVPDAKNGRVQQFSGQGEYLNQFGREGSLDQQLRTPFGLSVHSNGNFLVADAETKQIKIFSHTGHLMVCDTDNHRVQVFEQNGKFIKKFGTKGSELGEFDAPASSAVLSDGRIVVSDCGNNCIKIFE
ncbi:hypothetical protein ACROYT_G011027 [Oculina patagonica]